MKIKMLTAIALCALLSLPLAAEGVLPLPGKWVQGPCSATSRLELDGNKVVGMNVIPRKNLKYTRYSADQLIAPVSGDFAASAQLKYECKDKFFLGGVYFQLVDSNNKVFAYTGMVDGWEKVSGRISAGITGVKGGPKRQDLPYNGVMSLEIVRQGAQYTITVNGAAVFSGSGSTSAVRKLRLVFQADKRQGAHFGSFEFSNVSIKPLAADAAKRFSVFDETPKGGFSGAWTAVRQLNAKGLITEDTAEGMTIVGFKDLNDKAPAKAAHFMLRRNVPRCSGDFTALLDLAWDLPADRSYMGAVSLQLINPQNRVIAYGGLSDGWIIGSARLSGGIGKTIFKNRADVPDVGGMVFRIERRSGKVTVYAGARELVTFDNVQDAVASVRILFVQDFFRNAEGNILSKMGRFTVKRIAFDAPGK